MTTLRTLRKLPGVASVQQRDGRLWVRFRPDATSEQRDTFAEMLTGKRPQVRRFRAAPVQRDHSNPQPTTRRGGRAA